MRCVFMPLATIQIAEPSVVGSAHNDSFQRDSFLKPLLIKPNQTSKVIKLSHESVILPISLFINLIIDILKVVLKFLCFCQAFRSC